MSDSAPVSITKDSRRQKNLRALEDEVSRIGWSRVKPASLRGESGVKHDFALLAASGGARYAFDVSETATQYDVMRAYVKRLDTGSSVNVVCSSGMSDDATKKLAAEYGVGVIRGMDIHKFFESLRKRSPIRKRAKGSS